MLAGEPGRERRRCPLWTGTEPAGDDEDRERQTRTGGDERPRAVRVTPDRVGAGDAFEELDGGVLGKSGQGYPMRMAHRSAGAGS